MVFTSSEEEDNGKVDRDDEFKPESESEHDDEEEDLELEKEALEESDYENVSSDEVYSITTTITPSSPPSSPSTPALCDH